MPMEKLKKFIFTFAMDSPTQPYKGGWVEVIAPNIDLACKVFVAKYPLVNHLIPCAGIYYYDDFRKTLAYTDGNFGKYWLETLMYDEAVI